MNTPFQWMKQVASHYGGTRNPLIISWPKKIPENLYGGIREQWHHVIDIGKQQVAIKGQSCNSLLHDD